MDIQKIFNSANKIIEEEYYLGNILSERHLQAVFYANTWKKLRDLGYEVRVEPKLLSTNEKSDLQGYIPDVVVIHPKSKKIVAFVEMKYMPYGYVSYQWDFAKFNMCIDAAHKGSDGFYMDIETNTGNWNKGRIYTFSLDVLLVYVAIGKEGSSVFDDAELKQTELYKKGGSIIPLFVKLKG